MHQWKKRKKKKKKKHEEGFKKEKRKKKRQDPKIAFCSHGNHQDETERRGGRGERGEERMDDKRRVNTMKRGEKRRW